MGLFGPVILLLVFSGAWLETMQAPRPTTLETTKVVRGQADAELVDALFDRERVAIFANPGVLRVTLDQGAKLVEFFRLVTDGSYALLRHDRPAVRAMAAFHLLASSPSSVAMLEPLLGDDAAVYLVEGRDYRATTVAKTIVLMACAAAYLNADVGAFLEHVRRSFRFLGVRAEARNCPASPQGNGGDGIASVVPAAYPGALAVHLVVKARNIALDLAAPPTVILHRWRWTLEQSLRNKWELLRGNLRGRT